MTRKNSKDEFQLFPIAKSKLEIQSFKKPESKVLNPKSVHYWTF